MNNTYIVSVVVCMYMRSGYETLQYQYVCLYTVSPISAGGGGGEFSQDPALRTSRCWPVDGRGATVAAA